VTETAVTEEPSTIGLVGVGLLGSAIAERLASASFSVIAFDVAAQKLHAIAPHGITAATSPAEVARRCRRVVLSLPNSDVVAGVIEGSAGLAGAAAAGATIVDTTTGDPEATVAIAARLNRKGVAYLDATVAGSSTQFRQGQATLMVGGDAAAFEACRDLFAAWSERVFHTGPVGSGQRTKLLVNQVLGLNRLVLAESLALAEACGVDPARLLEILQATPAYSRVMDTKGAKMIAADFAPEARLAQHRKDVGLILEMARRAGGNLPVSTLHAELLDAAVAAGLGDLDNSAVIQVLRARTPQ